MALIAKDPMKNSKSELGLTIEGVINTLKEKQTYANIKKKTLCKELTDVISRIKNGNFKVFIEPTLSCNAHVFIPLLNRNNVVWNDFNRKYFGSYLEKTALKDLDKNKDKPLLGSIDEKGRYNGIYSTTPIDIVISHDLIYTSKRYPVSTAGTTAIVLHEIGHADTSLKLMGWSARTNYTLKQVNDNLMGNVDGTTKAEFIRSKAKAEYLEIDDIEGLAKTTDTNAINTVFLQAHIKQIRSELGSDVFDARGFEAIADNYAAQQGYGYDLVLALDQMPSYRLAKKGNVEAIMWGLLVLTVNLLILITSPVQYAILVLIILSLYNPKDVIYDRPHERSIRTAQAMVQFMKGNKNFTSEDIARIEHVYRIADSYVEERDFFMTIYELTTSNGRNSRSTRELQQHLEDFASSRLHLTAGKFKLLAQ